QIRTDPRYTLFASGLPLILRQTIATTRFSQNQSPDAPLSYEKSRLGRAWDLPGIGAASRCGQLGHDFDLHVAVLQLPFVVLLEQHRADQPDDRGFIGENANNVGAALDFFVEPFLQTAKLNGVNPQADLTDTLANIAAGHPISRI